MLPDSRPADFDDLELEEAVDSAVEFVTVSRLKVSPSHGISRSSMRGARTQCGLENIAVGIDAGGGIR